jgi:peroxiredoxin Q/BCP
MCDGRSVTLMKRGDRVSEFELPDQTGTPRTLTDLLADGPVVLFFYPAAGTPGCTREACHFRDLAGEFAAVGASRVGISTDPVDKQASFAKDQGFDYPLLADTDGAVASSFGVKRGLLGRFMPVKRTTFVIDTDRTVLDVISSEVNFNSHGDKALEVLRTRSSTAG